MAQAWVGIETPGTPFWLPYVLLLVLVQPLPAFTLLPREKILFMTSCACFFPDLGEVTLCPSEEQRHKLCSGGWAPPPKPRVTQCHFHRMLGDFGAICSIMVIICLRTGRVELRREWRHPSSVQEGLMAAQWAALPAVLGYLGSRRITRFLASWV